MAEQMSKTMEKVTEPKAEKAVPAKQETIKKTTMSTNEVKEDNNVIHFGDYHQVNSLDYTDYNDFVKLTDRRQSMDGFNPEYRDIVDYILRITHEIWEERGIGVIFDTYHNNTIAHACSGTSRGVLPVISGTLSHLHAFPDKKIVAESAIWSEDTPGYFFTSHRSMSGATNLGDSNFGPATMKKVKFRAIADCAIHNNRIYEEWLVRDNLWLVKQLGLDPLEVAKAFAKAEGSKPATALQTSFGYSEAVEGQFYPERYAAKDGSVGEMLLAMHQNIYNCKMINEVKTYFDKNAKVHYICDKELCGREEIQGTFISFLASFPNAFHTVERITVNNTPEPETFDVALRWRHRGLHEGIGMFGNPSGKFVEIMGINHYRIENGKIVESWVMYDGLDVIKQIVAGSDDEEA